MKESGEVDWLWREVADYVYQHNRHLEGRLLTQLEASMVPGRQLEALKEVVSNILWRESEDRYEFLFGVFTEYAESSQVATITFGKVKEVWADLAPPKG